jgi:hypothetical protein
MFRINLPYTTVDAERGVSKMAVISLVLIFIIAISKALQQQCGV